MAWKRRYTVLVVLFCAYLLSFMDRMVMASAIPFIAEDFDLSPLSMGVVLSAFFAGYAVMQIPGGLLADRFGPRAVLAISIAWWSMMTAVTGLVSGLVVLMVVRVLFGLGEGAFPSAASKSLSIWFPAHELGRATGLQLTSTAVGASVAPLFVAALIANWGWRSVFLSLFVPGILLSVLVWRFATNVPAEREADARGRETARDAPRKSTFADFMRTPAILWCAACIFLANTAGWGLANWLPTYLLQARGFDIGRMGMYAALVSIASAVGMPLGGYLCDKYFSRNLRIPIILGLAASSGFTYLAAVAPTGEWAVAYLALSAALGSIASPAIFTLPLLVVPKHAVGGAFGFVNTAGQMAGVFSPVLVGYILDATGRDFQIVFFCMIGISLMAIYPASRIRQMQAAPD
jgi:MFS family permease